MCSFSRLFHWQVGYCDLTYRAILLIHQEHELAWRKGSCILNGSKKSVHELSQNVFWAHCTVLDRPSGITTTMKICRCRWKLTLKFTDTIKITFTEENATKTNKQTNKFQWYFIVIVCHNKGKDRGKDFLNNKDL